MNAEIVALRVKLYNVERDLEDSKADYVKLAHLVCDLWHSSAAAYIPPWLQKRVRDVSHAQLAEAQRFPHGAAAVTGCDMKINDEGRSNAAYWHERAMKAEARLQKIMARCADLLDEDQFNELDANASVWAKHKETGIVTQFIRGKKMAQYRALILSKDVSATDEAKVIL